MGTADPAAIRTFRLTGTHALDKYSRVKLGQRAIVFNQFLVKVKADDDALILSKTVLACVGQGKLTVFARLGGCPATQARPALASEGRQTTAVWP